MDKSRIYKEQVVEYHIGPYTVRVWSDFNDECNYQEVSKAIFEIADNNSSHSQLSNEYSDEETVAEKILSLDKVNAVEVKYSSSGMGVVFYKDWP